MFPDLASDAATIVCDPCCKDRAFTWRGLNGMPCVFGFLGHSLFVGSLGAIPKKLGFAQAFLCLSVQTFQLQDGLVGSRRKRVRSRLVDHLGVFNEIKFVSHLGGSGNGIQCVAQSEMCQHVQ